MAKIDVDDYADIDSNPFEGAKPQVAPEDEFFHSVYFSGVTRKNSSGFEETVGKMQIRGVAYDLDEAHMIITHVKNVYVKNEKDQSTGRDKTTCFSFTDKEPWSGTNGHVCGRNRAERDADPWCSPCRSNLIIAGIYCDEKGNPKLQDKDGSKKPIFIFVKAKGLRYMLASDYVNKLSTLDPKELGPLTDISKPDNLAFEKRAINHKRFVTKLSKGKVVTQKGVEFAAVKFTEEMKLPDKVVIDILNLSKKTFDEFKKKFDWSLSKGKGSPSAGFTPSEGEKFDTVNNSKSEASPVLEDSFNFDNVTFGDS